MKIGFTGTRHGMSDRQKETFVLRLQELSPTEFHHGDCRGADAQAHILVREFFPDVKIVVHPPLSTYLRAFCVGDVMLEPLDYIPRDENIVKQTEYLVAAPKSDHEEKRSGTWYTVRYARRKDRPHYIMPR